VTTMSHWFYIVHASNSPLLSSSLIYLAQLVSNRHDRHPRTSLALNFQHTHQRINMKIQKCSSKVHEGCILTRHDLSHFIFRRLFGERRVWREFSLGLDLDLGTAIMCILVHYLGGNFDLSP
jgi:hypothetical protein